MFCYIITIISSCNAYLLPLFYSLDPIRFLFDDYKLSRWYFEVVDLYRRIIFMAVLPLLSKDNAIVSYIGFMLAFLSSIYIRELSPFRVEFTNVIAVIGQYVILLVFMAALLIETGSLSSLNLSNLALGIILLSINLLIILLVVIGALLRYHSEGGYVKRSSKSINIEWAPHFIDTKVSRMYTNFIVFLLNRFLIVPCMCLTFLFFFIQCICVLHDSSSKLHLSLLRRGISRMRIY